MNFIKKAKWTYIGFSLFYLILGICLIIWPQISVIALCYLMGAITLLCGVIKIITYFVKDEYSMPFQFDLVFGIFTATIGLILLLHSGDVIVMLPIVIGITILVDSMFKLQISIDAKRAGMSKWWVILLLVIGCVILGITLVINPFESVSALMMLIGITLVIDGIQNIWTVIYTWKLVKKATPADKIFVEINGD